MKFERLSFLQFTDQDVFLMHALSNRLRLVSRTYCEDFPNKNSKDLEPKPLRVITLSMHVHTSWT